jgi:hypothetical protein
MMLLSTLVVYGVLHAVHWYSGNSGDPMGASYALAFGCFRNLGLALPEIAFDVSSIGRFFARLSVVLKFNLDLTPNFLLEGSGALSSLNFVLSLARPLISRLNVVVYGVEELLKNRDKKRAAEGRRGKVVQFKEIADHSYLARMNARLPRGLFQPVRYALAGINRQRPSVRWRKRWQLKGD